MPAEQTFAAMGSTAHVVVVGAHAEQLVREARLRIADLEARWSRFLPTSEVSQLNAATGRPVLVSSETYALVARAMELVRVTGGAFDPSVLGDVIRAGYDRNFAAVRAKPRGGVSALGLGIAGVVLDPIARVVTLPTGVGFDPGGIGKGFAADVVTCELLAAGADGVSVNVGGDVRVAGVAPDGGVWRVAVEDPRPGVPDVVVALDHGAVATSATNSRAWSVCGAERHHLIDPATRLSADRGVLGVTVIARECWRAEGLTKMVVANGTCDGVARCEALGSPARAVDGDGSVQSSASWNSYVLVRSECA